MQSTIAEPRLTSGKPQRLEVTFGRLAPATVVFILLASAIMAIAIYTAFNLSAVVSYKRDIWHHLSVYRELIASPFHAMNPHVATDDPSRSYSPWTVMVALLARTFGLDSFGAIAVSAILSSLSVVVGIFLFSREYLKHAWAPALFLIAFFGSWMSFVNHTGYHTVATFVYSASYPFAIVLGLGFVLWWLVLKALSASSLQLILCIGIFIPLSAALFIIHQLQGLFAVGAGVAFALFASQASLHRRIVLSSSLIVGLLLSQYWWYFDPIAYVFNPEVRGGHSSTRMLGYSAQNLSVIFWTLGISWLGIAGLVNIRSSRFRLELALPLLVLASGFTLLLVTGNWVSTRILPFIALFLQIGLVAYILTDGAAVSRTTMTLKGALIAALVVGLSYNVYKGHETYQKSRTFLETGYIVKHYDTWSRDILAASNFAVTLVPEGATVIAHRETAFPMEATSLAVVAIPRLFAEVPDMLDRQSNNTAFFDKATSLAERCQILAQYDVQMIVYRDRWLDDVVETQLGTFGTRLPYGDMSFIASENGQFPGCSA